MRVEFEFVLKKNGKQVAAQKGDLDLLVLQKEIDSIVVRQKA